MQMLMRKYRYCLTQRVRLCLYRRRRSSSSKVLPPAAALAMASAAPRVPAAYAICLC